MLNLQRLAGSFRYAFQGLSHTFKYNQNIKIHLIIAFLVLFSGLFFGLTRSEMFALGVVIVMVISAEMVNTAIEEMVNLLVNEHRKEAKIAKDVGAGMVLLVVLFAVIVGIFAFLPHILTLFQ